MPLLRLLLPIPVLILILIPGNVAADTPRVVTSILPLHSLVSALLEDISEPDLLLPPGVSPHGYALRPSMARRLHEADLIIWVGPALETFLERSLHGRDDRQRHIRLMEDLELDLLPTRSGGVWEDTHHHAEHEHGHDEHGHGHDTLYLDSHLWLSPAIVHDLVHQLADRLAELHPEARTHIRANRDDLLKRIEALDAELTTRLEPLRDRAYLVFHDAYQYFEEHYGLNAVGSVHLDPARAPGARRVGELRERIRAGGVACIFTEPQFRPALAERLVERTQTRLGELDPVGSKLQPGPDAWFELMRDMATSLESCLGED